MDDLLNIKNSILSFPPDQRHFEQNRDIWFHYKHYLGNFYRYLCNEVLSGDNRRRVREIMRYLNLDRIGNNEARIDERIVYIVDELLKLDADLIRIIQHESDKWNNQTMEVLHITSH